LSDPTSSHVRLTRTAGPALALLFTVLASCGPNHQPEASTDNTRATVAPESSATTPGSTNSSRTVATTSAQPSEPATVAPSPMSPATTAPTGQIVLRGDGLGALPFGTSQDTAIAYLTDLLGPPGIDAGPLTLMVTQVLNGCAQTSDWAAMFAGSLVVGFTDEGDGPVLTSWSAFQNGDSTEEIPIPLATEAPLPLGATLADARRTYGDRLLSQPESGWIWPFPAPPAAIDADGGTIALIDLFRNGHFDMLTTGVECGPTGVLDEPLGEAPLGLRYYSRVGGADALGVQVDASTGHDTIWSTFGGACVENCEASIDIVGETSSGVATMLWAARNIEQRGDGSTVWAVTDVLPIQADLAMFGSYDCGAGVPLVDASNAIVKLMTVDLDSGHFVEMPIDDGHCSVVGE
jgi:hypothetical protein